MISICITVINEPELTRKCIESVQTYTRHPFEIVVCDNGSTNQETIDYLNSLDKNNEIRLIRNHTNVGCGPAWNQELLWVDPQTDYVTILHNDAEVIRDWVDIMTAPFGPKVGLVASERIGNHPDNRFVAGVITNERQVAAGPIYVIKKSVLDEVGLLDEQFRPIYFDDADWMLRFKLWGYDLFVTLDGKFPHVEFTTTAKPRDPVSVGQIVDRNRERMRRKWEGTYLSLLPGWDGISAPPEPETWIYNGGRQFLRVRRSDHQVTASETCIAPYRVSADECSQCSNSRCWKKFLPQEELNEVREIGLPLYPDYPPDINVIR